jgi:hypothetical protein
MIVGNFKLTAFSLDLLEKTRVVYGKRKLLGHRVDELDVTLRECV